MDMEFMYFSVLFLYFILIRGKWMCWKISWGCRETLVFRSKNMVDMDIIG